MASRAVEWHEGGWASLALEALASPAGLLEALESLRERGGVHCALLSGERFELSGSLASESELRRLALFDLPLIYAFEGGLAGQACEVALGCDIRICGPHATMRPDSWTTPRLGRLLGYVGRPDPLERGASLTARKALALGLVSHVADAETAIDYASRLAATIASRGPVATRLAREAIWRGLEMPLEQALRFETDLTLLLQTTDDRAEGVRAFIEKRPPKFTGD